jgi:hypothetical protein
MRIKPGSCLVQGNLVNLDGQCLTKTFCGGLVYNIFVSSKLVFLPLTRITKQSTRERSARSRWGFATLLSYNCFTPSFIWKKTFVLSTKTVDYFFVDSLLKRLKNILIFSMILQGTSGCGWVKTIDMFTGYEIYHSVG